MEVGQFGDMSQRRQVGLEEKILHELVALAGDEHGVHQRGFPHHLEQPPPGASTASSAVL